MSRYPKLHPTSTTSLLHLSKYACKYKDTLSISPGPTVHKRTKYLKVIRKITTAYGSFQGLQNPFSPSSCSSNSSQYLKLLKRHGKHIQSVQPHQILCQKPQFQRLISKFPLKSLVIDTVQDSGFQLFFQSRFCQIVKLTHKQPYVSPNQPVCLHTLQKILNDTPRRELLQLPAAVRAHQAAGRRLSFEPDGDQEDNVNRDNNDAQAIPVPETPPVYADSAAVVQQTLDSSLDLTRKNISKFFYRGLRLRSLKKVVIETNISRESIQFLKSLNYSLQKKGNIELEIYVKGAHLLSNSEKNELTRLSEVWKRVSLLSFELKGKEAVLLEILKPISEMLRNLKKIELKAASLDQENSYHCLENLGSLPFGLLNMSLVLKQVRHSEVSALLDSLRLPKGIRNLSVRLSEACINFSSECSYYSSFNSQYKALYNALMEKLEDVAGGKLEVKLKEGQKTRMIKAPASIGKRQRTYDAKGTAHYLETPRKRGSY